MLKYVILASILASSEINYAETREAKVYKDDPEIMAVMKMRTAFENKDMDRIQEILADGSNNIA